MKPIKDLFIKMKKWFFKKPDGDFWMYAFFISIVLRWVLPATLMCLVFLQVGIAVPDMDAAQYNTIIDNAGQRIANAYTTAMKMLLATGQDLATNSPIFAQVIFHAISAFVYSVYAGLVLIVCLFAKFILAWLARKNKKIDRWAKK